MTHPSVCHQGESAVPSEAMAAMSRHVVQWLHLLAWLVSPSSSCPGQPTGEQTKWLISHDHTEHSTGSEDCLINLC